MSYIKVKPNVGVKLEAVELISIGQKDEQWLIKLVLRNNEVVYSNPHPSEDECKKVVKRVFNIQL